MAAGTKMELGLEREGRPSLQAEKEKRSTLSRLRVDSGLWSFFKLLEVGVSPYLSFIPILSILSMFESNEAVRGRLIGPKPWDRIDINFETKNGAVVYGYGLFGCSLC